MRFPLCVIVTLSLLIASAVYAADWPQWLGSNRDSRWVEKGILTDFPKEGLKTVWSAPVGVGYAGPAVANGQVFVMDFERIEGTLENNPASRAEVRGKERVQCLDAKTGKKVWEYDSEVTYKISYPNGPRCTPTVDGDFVYTVGAVGHLHCFNVRNGAVAWKRDLIQDFHARLPMWGCAAHPLIHHDLLICLVGGNDTAVVAFEKATGKEVWRSLSADDTGYCPPTIIHAGGVDQLLIWLPSSLYSLNPMNGSMYWSVELEPRYGMSVAAPRRSGDYLYTGGMYTTGVMLHLDSDKPAVQELWRGKRGIGAYPSTSTPIADGDVFYAVDHSGVLIAFDAKTGTRFWETSTPTVGIADSPAPHATAHLVRHEDHVFIFSETGELHLAELSAKSYKELDRVKLIEPTGEAYRRQVVWSHPAFAQKCIFVRNDKELICCSLAKE